MFRRKEDTISPEEYLALEETAEDRSEYYRGEIFAMSGASVNHNRIAKNTVTGLDTAFAGKPCEAFITDMRLLVRPNGLYTYPDVMVVCGPLQFAPDRDDTLTNPTVIFEVLSKSTEGYDRGAKFELYRALESLQDYVLVDQYKIHVEHFHRLDDGRWILQEFNQLEATLHLETVDATLPLEHIYRNVTWEE
ncbi:MAG: Uma2 family endonuclease [Anaerolineae bacterium]